MGCKTCGGENGNHIPSLLDKDGVGHALHKYVLDVPRSLYDPYETMKLIAKYGNDLTPIELEKELVKLSGYIGDKQREYYTKGKDSVKDLEDESLDQYEIGNWVSARLNEMLDPLFKGQFMKGGITPHTYLTQEVHNLIFDRLIGELQYLRRLRDVNGKKKLNEAVIDERIANLESNMGKIK